MADWHGRPPYNYSNDRRRSQPDNVSRRDQYPESRPPIRSYSTMSGPRDESRDSRTRDARNNAAPGDPRLQNKRPASRSPDSFQPAKIPRIDTAAQSTATANGSTSSRRSSVSSGTPAKSNVKGSADRAPPGFNSPHIRSGLRDGVYSGHSTPQPTADLNNAPAITDLVPLGTTLVGDENLMFQVFLQLSQVYAESSQIHMHRTQVEARVQRAEQEIKLQRSNLKQFPAIEKQKRAAKESAEKQLALLAKESIENQAQQQQRMQGLATTLEELTVPKQPIISKEEFVSRAEHDSLNKKFEELMFTVRGLQTEVGDVKQSQEEATTDLGVQLHKLQDDTGRLSRWKIDFVPRVDQIEESLDKLGDLLVFKTNSETLFKWKSTTEPQLKKLESVEKDVKSIQVSLKDGFASKTGQWKLQERQDTLSQGFETLQKSFKDFGKFKSIKSVVTLSEENEKREKDPLHLNAELSEKIDMLVEQGPQRLVGVESVVERVQGLVELVEADMRVVKDQIYEEKDGTLKQRIIKIENAMLAMPSSDSRRLDQLEETVETLQNRTQQPDLPNAQSNLNENHSDLYMRLESLEKLLPVLEKTCDDMQDTVSEHVDKEIAAAQLLFEKFQGDFECRLQGLEAASNHSNDDYVDGQIKTTDSKIEKLATKTESSIQKLEQTSTWTIEMTNAATSKVKSDFQQAIELVRKEVGKLSTDAVDLKDEVQSLKGQHQQLQNQQVTRAPTPVQPNTQPPPLLPRQSPHLQNGQISSSLTNGVSRSPAAPLSASDPAPQLQSPTSHNQILGDAPSNKMLGDHCRLLDQRFDAISMALDHLKRRYDNLTTDEVVKAMLNQFEVLWPHAKNYEQSLAAVKNEVQEMRNKLNRDREGEVMRLNKLLGGLPHSMQVQSDMTTLKGDVAQLQKGLKDVKADSGGEGSAGAALKKQTVDDLKTRLQKCEAGLQECVEAATDTRNVVVKHTAALAKLERQGLSTVDIKILEKRVGNCEEAALQHGGKVNEIDHLNSAIGAIQGTTRAFEEKLTKTSTKVGTIERMLTG